MKALTLTQPWATLVALGAKGIETRSWATSHRGPVAIHAAKGLADLGGERGLTALCEREPFRSVLEEAGITSPKELPRGAVVAMAELVDCRPTQIDRHGLALYQQPDGIWMNVSEQERAFGDYRPGRYAWLLADVQLLPEPIPAKGALGLWPWTMPVEQAHA
jgi:activating signal cointegrator 1